MTTVVTVIIVALRCWSPWPSLGCSSVRRQAEGASG